MRKLLFLMRRKRRKRREGGRGERRRRLCWQGGRGRLGEWRDVVAVVVDIVVVAVAVVLVGRSWLLCVKLCGTEHGKVNMVSESGGSGGGREGGLGQRQGRYAREQSLPREVVMKKTRQPRGLLVACMGRGR